MSLMARSKFIVLVLLSSLVFAGAAYAYGIQRHTSNFYDHGCGYTVDDGCTGATNDDGDYFRRGFISTGSSVKDYLNVEIWNAQTNSKKTYGDCLNCTFVYPGWDTNPTFECRFKTWHVAVNNSVITLNGHWHWTQAATNSTGAC